MRTLFCSILGLVIFLFYLPITLYEGKFKQEFRIFCDLQYIVWICRNKKFTDFYLKIIDYLISKK